jgi:hypothetical protein
MVKSKNLGFANFKEVCKTLFSVFVLVVISLKIFSQTAPGFFSSQIQLSTSNFSPTTSFNLKQFAPQQIKVKDGAIKIWIDYDNLHAYEYSQTEALVNHKVTFDLIFLNNSDVLVQYNNLSLEISGGIDYKLPEALYAKIIDEFKSAENSPTGLVYYNEEINMYEPITKVSIFYHSFEIGGVASNFPNYLKFHAGYDINYEIAPTLSPVLEIDNLIPEDDIESKTATFNWVANSNEVDQNFQFQLLRLFNQVEFDNNSDLTEIQLAQPIDWSKALTIETDTKIPELNISIAEGTGYYVWRVRPIGTLPGGIANDKNWGLWSAHINPPASIEVPYPIDNTLDLSESSIFFFTDPDEDKNYIYTRVFSEENKIGETIQYANGLGQLKQSQSFIPSNGGYTIVSQNVFDRNGRPALSTLPVPVTGRMDKFKEGFVKNSETGELYKAADFDVESTLQNPAKINDGYYNNSNPDPQIPNADGYPFTRTIFDNDGSGRVIEQSGTGDALRMGNGHTQKVYYETPSQDELVMMFGDEAPISQNVFKTITVDQNNTASISYTNKEGQVIATALSFLDEPDNLLPLQNGENTDGITDLDVEDVVTENIKTSEGFSSTKKLVVLNDNSSFNINEYKIKCSDLGGLCSSGSLGCEYTLTISIFKLDDPNNASPVEYYRYGPFDVNTGLCNDGWFTINQSSLTAQSLDLTTVAPLDNAPALLNKGNYLIVKKLIPKATNASLEAAVTTIGGQINPIADWIKGRLGDINCEKELYLFYNDLVVFTNWFNDPASNLEAGVEFTCTGCSGAGNGYSFSAEFVEEHELNEELFLMNYYLEVPDNNNDGERDSELLTMGTNLPFVPGDGIKPQYIDIYTSCCNIRLPLIYSPPFKCPEPVALDAFVTSAYLNGYDHFEINTDIFNPDVIPPAGKEFWATDFEGYAISTLNDCMNDLPKAKYAFYKNIIGWHKPGMFNQMVYHMLTDQYNTLGHNLDLDNNTETNPCSAEATCPDVETLDPEADLCTPFSGLPYKCAQYSCGDLIDCWKGLVDLMLMQSCENFSLSLGMADPVNISNETADNAGGVDGIGGEGDDTINENFQIDGVKPIGWLVEMIASAKMRKEDNVELEAPSVTDDASKQTFNMVELFLSCTGYKFADIVRGNPFNSTILLNSPETRNGNVDNVGNCLHLDADFDDDPNNGDYVVNELDGTHDFFYNPDNTEIIIPALYDPNVTLPIIEDITNVDDWRSKNSRTGMGQTLGKIFPLISNPIYAFKYFQYNYGSQPELELLTCFKDPNKCVDIGGLEVPCCTTDGTTAKNCNFCGFGEVTCNYIKKSWNSNMRLTFYNMVKSKNGTIVQLPEDPIGTEPNYCSPSQAAIVMNDKILACTDLCTSRTSEFKSSVVDMFEDRCYVIGGCKITENDNIVPTADLDAIVLKVVDQCKSQCKLSTYACEEKTCRLISAPETELYALDHGEDQEEAKLLYGVGGRYNNTEYPLSSALNVNCAGCDPISFPEEVSLPKQVTLTAGEEYTWVEYTLHTQAKTWDLDLAIKSKCNTVNCTYDPNLSTTIEYVKNDQGGCDLQIFQPVNCDPLYNTALPKNLYEVLTVGTPIDSESDFFETPVASPKKGLTISTPE